MSDRDDKKRIQEIADMVGEAIMAAVAGPETGQNELTEEQRAKIKSEVSDAFSEFLELKSWATKVKPTTETFRKQHIEKVRKIEHGSHFKYILEELYPSLDAQYEGHAVLYLIAKMVGSGKFRKISDDTLAKIVEEVFSISGVVIAYLAWRVKTTTPSKEEQH